MVTEALRQQRARVQNDDGLPELTAPGLWSQYLGKPVRPMTSREVLTFLWLWSIIIKSKATSLRSV